MKLMLYVGACDDKPIRKRKTKMKQRIEEKSPPISFLSFENVEPNRRNEKYEVEK